MNNNSEKIKPEFHINLSANSPNALEAVGTLSTLDPNFGYHVTNNLRPALGIYNTSTARICEKTIKCCEYLEQYIKTSNRVEELNKHVRLQKQLVDYIELSLYAAAEHVDDLDSIAKGFFDTNSTIKKSKPLKTFENQIKLHKNLISASANAIKHSQARIRLYSLEFLHDKINTCMHGYFIEGVNNGEIGPSNIFHKDNSQVFSITSLVWEIVVFVLHSSRCLNNFLQSIEIPQSTNLSENNDPFKCLVIAAARLPLFSFDDNHPFLQTRLIIDGDMESKKLLVSEIYGSISKGWTKSNLHQFGNYSSSYKGDGVSRTFKIVKPSQISFNIGINR